MSARKIPGSQMPGARDARLEHGEFQRRARAFFEGRVRKLHAEGLTDSQIAMRLGEGARSIRRELGLKRNEADEKWGDL